MDMTEQRPMQANAGQVEGGEFGPAAAPAGLFRFPDPVLDQREQQLISELAEEFARFTRPGAVARPLKAAWRAVGRLLPFDAAAVAGEVMDYVARQDVVQRAGASARNTIVRASRRASRFTRTRSGTVAILRESLLDVDDFDQICGLRSYDIEKVVKRRNLSDLVVTAYEGALTGAPGLPGVPVNLALMSLLLFRAVQSIAIYYGYDLKGEAGEMEFAAAVTLNCLAGTPETSTDAMTVLIGKLMVAANLSALRAAVPASVVDAAGRGSLSVLSTYVRTMVTSGGRAAADAGWDSIERPVFRNLMRQVTRRIPAETLKRAIPILGALTGALSDVYYMRRVLHGANLVYHKRFLLEKEERCERLRRNRGWKPQ